MIHSIKLECMLQMILETYITSQLLEVTYQIRECIVVQCGSIYDYSANTAQVQTRVRGRKTRWITGQTQNPAVMLLYNDDAQIYAVTLVANVTLAPGTTTILSAGGIPSAYRPSNPIQAPVWNSNSFVQLNTDGGITGINFSGSPATLTINTEFTYHK